MRKRFLSLLLVVMLVCIQLIGCRGMMGVSNAGGTSEDETESETEITPIVGEIITIYMREDYVESGEGNLLNSLLYKFFRESEKYKDCGFIMEVKYRNSESREHAYTNGDIIYTTGDEFLKVQSKYELLPLTGTVHENQIKQRNDSASSNAYTVNGEMYGFPFESHSAFFMYYDKSVIANPNSLEEIVAACRASNTKIVFTTSTDWYTKAFFLGTGATVVPTYRDGEVIGYNSDYATPAGVVAYREWCKLLNSGVVAEPNSADAENASVYIGGIWEAERIKSKFGDNYATAILPAFEGVDGNTYRMKSHSGHYGYVVMKQESAERNQLCLDVANYLSSEEVQRELLQLIGNNPSNLEVQKDAIIKNDPTRTTLMQQMEYAIVEQRLPDEYWEPYETYSNDVSDDILLNELLNRMEKIKNGEIIEPY